MIKKVAKRVCFLSGILMFLLLCTGLLLPIRAKAETVMHMISIGNAFESNMNPDDDLFIFQMEERANVTLTFQVYNHKPTDLQLKQPGGVEKPAIIKIGNFKRTYDKSTKMYTYTGNCTLDPGWYGLFIMNGYDYTDKFKLLVTSEPEIILSKTAITGITNTKQRTMTVSYNPVKKRLGYQIEYATDSKFKDKNRVNTGATTKDIGKLTRGKTYYVRVRVYARYESGALVYSKWSGTKKIKITK